MPTYNLGNGADVFNSATANPAFTDGSTVSGGNGRDSITVVGFNNVTLAGDNGNDTISASTNPDNLQGEGNSISGGNGSDVLTLDGRVGVVNGGNGADVITVINDFGNVFSSNTVIGGADTDKFIIQNTNLFDVANFSGNNQVADDTDIISGGFDLIQDFTAGETLDIPASVRLSGPIAVDHDFPFDPVGEMRLADGEFTVFRGTYLGTGSFRVDSAGGTDLLVAWDTANGVDGTFLDQGSVVLLGVTDTSGIVFA